MAKGVVLGDHIFEILGGRHTRSSILSSASLAVLCLFYVYTVGTFLQVRIYPLIDRVTYYIPFDFYIINEYVDHIVIGALLVLWFAFSIKRTKAGYAAVGAFTALFAAAAAANNDLALDAIALSALPAMVVVLIYSSYSKGILENDSRLWINYLALVGMVIGIISFAIAVSTIATHNTAGYPIERNYAYGVFVLFSSASPILILLLITCFPVKLLIGFVASKVRKLQELDTKDIAISGRTKAIYLTLFMLLSVIIAVIPHLGTVNPDSRIVGVDTRYYVTWVGALNDSINAQDFLYQAFVQQRGGDRPVSLIFIYSLQQLTGVDLPSIIEYTPLILGPALLLAVYFLTRELTSSNVISLLAAFLTALSFQILIGIYAGFYANWMALVIGYISFVFLFRFLKRGGRISFASFLALFTLMLFTHVYTWSILSIVSGIFLLTILKTNYYNKRNAGLLLIALLGTIGIDLVRVGVTGASSGIEEDLTIAERLVGLDQFTLRWNSLTYTTTTVVAGIFSNAIILGLGIIWLIKSKIHNPTNIFIISFLSIGILPFLFGGWAIQTRTFYDIPFQIPAALALSYIVMQPGVKIKSWSVCLWLVTIAIIAVSNFYFMVPGPAEIVPPENSTPLS